MVNSKENTRTDDSPNSMENSAENSRGFTGGTGIGGGTTGRGLTGLTGFGLRGI
jgi:hypothetical protein